MENLIKALQIFLKYGNPDLPTYCIDKIMYVNINPILVSEEDLFILKQLGFYVENERGDKSFFSYKYGEW